MLTDEYKLDFSVAVFFVPLFSHIRILCKIEFLLFLRECDKPLALLCCSNLNACLLKYINIVSLVIKPENTLCTNYALWPVLNKLLKLVLIERTNAVVNK